MLLAGCWVKVPTTWTSWNPNTNVVVNAGQTVPVVFNIEPGYIGGTITVIGATGAQVDVLSETRRTENNSYGLGVDTVGRQSIDLIVLGPSPLIRLTLMFTVSLIRIREPISVNGNIQM